MSSKKTRIDLAKKSKIAFVGSGGAAKAGAFHLGVALALQEKGFKFVGGLQSKAEKSPSDTSGTREISTYVGSSAGSLTTAYLACGYSLDQIFDAFLGKSEKEQGNYLRPLKKLSYSNMFSLKTESNLLNSITSFTETAKIPAFGKLLQAFAKDSYENFFRLKLLKWSGLFSTAGIERYMREDVLPSNDFSSYAADLYIVATQLNHSKKVVFGKHELVSEDKTVLYNNKTKISEAIAASTALPPIFSPFPIKNDRGQTIYYFDGEIRDTLSTHVASDAGADLIIASYTHQPYHFSREIGSLHQYGMPAIMIQALYLLIEKKIQNFFDAQSRTIAALNATASFFKEHELPDHLRKQLLEILEKKLGHKRGIDYIYIHPKSSDHQMFFGDHFNLSGRRMSEIVKLGFRCAIDSLRRYDFI